MRKGFDGLYGLVRDRLGEDPLSGHLFLFTNRGEKPTEGSGVGRQRAMGLREAVGEGPFPLAGGTGRTVSHDAAGRVGNAVNGLDLAEARPRKNWLRRLPAA